MKRLILSAALAGVLMLAQGRRTGPETPDPSKSEEIRLPNGKLQRDEMLKADYAKNLTDVAELARLAAEVQEDIGKNDSYVVSVKTLKKLDEISKLAHNI